MTQTTPAEYTTPGAAMAAPGTPVEAENGGKNPELFVQQFLSLMRPALRSLLLLRVSLDSLRISPWQLVALIVCSTLVSIGAQWLNMEGRVDFYGEALMWGWWGPLLSLWLCWQVSLWARGQAQPFSIAALFALILWQDMFLTLLRALAHLLIVQPFYADNTTANWVLYLLISAWGVLAFWILLVRACRARFKQYLLIALVPIGTVLISYFHYPPMFWYPASGEDKAENEALQFSQSNIEEQFEIARQQRQSLKPERSGVIDLYGISFMPYAAKVFLNESHMIQSVLSNRFAADGHLQELINHPQTMKSKPWATNENLQRAIQSAAETMNRDEDILFIYLSSHGGKDAKLSARHWPLETESLTPYNLNLWLDKARIKYRVIVVSACYSGSWIAALSNGNTLVITAADATHTSYGCGSKSDLTYFGRAMFDEQLKTTYSFAQAFKAALPIIKQREIEGKKDDGFSNPQMVIGEQIKPVLERFAAQFEH